MAVLTVSDRASRGEYADEAGPLVERMIEEGGGVVVARAIVPDEMEEIVRMLREWSDGGVADLILTTGGTGLGKRDVTPEATARVVERVIPGIAEAMRASGLRSTPYAMLSRQVAGARGRTVIVNLPGSPKAAAESLAAIVAALPHAVEMLA